MSFTMRYIQKEDNQAAASIVRSVLAEFGRSGPGYACDDPETEDLYSAYQFPTSRFRVIYDEDSEQLVGCGGFSQLKGTEPYDKICELQKLYFLPCIRGKGLGKRLLTALTEEAAALGYRYMYLESLPDLKQAVSLYQKAGFEFIEHSKGNTGHQEKCSVYMLLNLTNQ